MNEFIKVSNILHLRVFVNIFCTLLDFLPQEKILNLLRVSRGIPHFSWPAIMDWLSTLFVIVN